MDPPLSLAPAVFLLRHVFNHHALDEHGKQGLHLQHRNKLRDSGFRQQSAANCRNAWVACVARTTCVPTWQHIVGLLASLLQRDNPTLRRIPFLTHNDFPEQLLGLELHQLFSQSCPEQHIAIRREVKIFQGRNDHPAGETGVFKDLCDAVLQCEIFSHDGD